MPYQIEQKTGLRLIQGHLQCQMAFGPVKIIAAPESAPPFKIDARAYEEDTWLVMSAEPKVCLPEVHPIRLMTELIEARPKNAGSVMVRGNHPLRFLAIVHDVNLEPTWKEEWIETAIAKIFQESEKRNIGAIGLPLLGTLHGRLEPTRFALILGRVIKKAVLTHLRRVWLISPIRTNREVISTLKTVLQ
jgi:hypothetical protein